MSSKVSLLFVIIALSLVAGCASQQRTILPDPREQYDFAESKYDQEKYDEAILEFQKVIFNYPGLKYIDSAHYWFSLSYYGREDYYLCAAELRRLINAFPSSELLDDAQLMIGKSYLDTAPGNIGLDQSDTETGIKELEAFLEDYPNSDRRQEGERLLSQAIEKMVTKHFLAGRQYGRMGNLISSRLYYEDLIKEYPESKHVPEVLYRLAEIDLKEGKYTDARDKLNNLIETFPNSKFAEKAHKLQEKIAGKIAEETRVEVNDSSATESNSE